MSNVENYRAMVATYRLVYEARHAVSGKSGKPKPMDTECTRAIDCLLRCAEELPDSAPVTRELEVKIVEFERKYVKRNERGEIVGFSD